MVSGHDPRQAPAHVTGGVEVSPDLAKVVAEKALVEINKRIADGDAKNPGKAG